MATAKTAAKKATTKKAVANTKESQVPAEYDYGDAGGAGFETTTADDIGIPYLAVLQALSPQLRKKDTQYVEGAEAGHLFNTVTKECSSSLVIVPCAILKEYVAWADRKEDGSGGGPYGRFDLDDPVVKQAIADNGGERIGGDGLFTMIGGKRRILVETHYVYSLVLDEDASNVVGYIVVPFSSTKLSVKKNWLGAINALKGVINPPLFAFVCKFSTQEQENEHGHFFNFDIQPYNDNWRESLLPKSSPIFATGEAFYKAVMGGEVKVAEGTERATQSGGSAAEADEEIPF